jgi:hypothetical protein
MRHLPFLVAAILLPMRAEAAEEDFQVWNAANLTFKMADRVSLTLEAQARWSDDAGRLGQALMRPSVGYAITPTTTASLGYAFFYNNPSDGSRTDEHRVWQQMSFQLAGDGQGLTVTGRSRLEQRWVEGRDDLGWRFRQQVRLTAPLSGKLRALAWSEAFLAFNDTSWGQRDGLDRWRNGVGVVIPLSPSVSIEPGYVNQWINRRDTDRVHHIANIAVNARF